MDLTAACECGHNFALNAENCSVNGTTLTVVCPNCGKDKSAHIKNRGDEEKAAYEARREAELEAAGRGDPMAEAHNRT
jgi:hypothetical protein